MVSRPRSAMLIPSCTQRSKKSGVLYSPSPYQRYSGWNRCDSVRGCHCYSPDGVYQQHPTALPTEMLGWLVHLCIFRMKIILRHLRFKFQAQFILFFIQLSLGWLACHPRAFADCSLLCTSPLRGSRSLHLLLLLSNQPDFRGGFITIWEKSFLFSISPVLYGSGFLW